MRFHHPHLQSWVRKIAVQVVPWRLIYTLDS